MAKNLEAFKNACEDLTKILGLKDDQDNDFDFTDYNKSECEDFLKQASEFIKPEDGEELAENTLQVLRETGVWMNDETGAETEVTDEEEENEDSLLEIINAAETRPDLANICKIYDEFKGLRAELSKYKTFKTLETKMLEVLGETVEEEEEEEIIEEVTKIKKGKPNPKAKMEVTKKEKTKTAPKPKKEGKKGPGVIATIVECIENAGKNGISKEEILDVLVEKIPDKEKESMKKTINVQVPGRISKERFEVIKLENGNFKKK